MMVGVSWENSEVCRFYEFHPSEMMAPSMGFLDGSSKETAAHGGMAWG